MTQIVPRPESLAKLVFLVRGEKVLLDTDLADLYGVEARVLNQSVSRNRARFPEDFMFHLPPKNGRLCGHKLWPHQPLQPASRRELSRGPRLMRV